jgi:hypothetical protein
VAGACFVVVFVFPELSCNVQASGALAPWMQSMSHALLTRDGSDTNAYAMADLGIDERQVLCACSYLATTVGPFNRSASLGSTFPHLPRSMGRSFESTFWHCWTPTSPTRRNMTAATIRK